MRQLWETPNMDLIKLEVDDVITSSPGSGLGIVDDPNTPEGNTSFGDFVNGVNP